MLLNYAYGQPPAYGNPGQQQLQQPQSGWGPISFIGSPSFENSFGSVPPSVVSQMCHSSGHSAVACPSRVVQAHAPALAVSTGESTPAVWYPDSGASAHMTSNEGHNFGEGTPPSFQ
ncbi:unnamed protein product [Cuscuta europaea]|uniref:Uncharacterized protein n=1 Tax=Cuscuta europaea TaxID=41803 RepID=A0A9P0YY09_CUSEU|nr:unnamed protein product [Cuscuta europaea]